MLKKFLAASAIATGIAGLLAGGNAFAATTTMPYEPGTVLDISAASNYTICYSGGLGDSYAGEPIIAYLWGDNDTDQIIIENLSSFSAQCETTLGAYHHYSKLRFMVPMGISGLTISVDESRGYYSLGLSGAEVSNKYLRSYGESSSRVLKTQVKISFNPNHGNGWMAPIKNVPVGSSTDLPPSTMTKSGYRFAGWNTKADGTGTSYADEATITPATSDNITLYAQWIESKARLGYGPTVNAKLKTAAGTDCSGSSEPYRVGNASIKAIRLATALPEGFDTNDSANIVSDSNSLIKIYAWFDDRDIDEDGEGDGVIYLYSDADVIMGASIMFGMFANMQSLSDISALAELDTSTTDSLAWVFMWDYALEDISALASWDTSNVRSLDSLFSYTKVANTDALETRQHPGKDYASWDVSKATNMHGLFWGVSTLGDISALASWDTSNVTDMGSMFGGNEVKPLSDISALATWNTSKVTTMSHMLRLLSIANADALETKQHPGKDYVSWDVSKVTDMHMMFDNNRSLTDISALASWDTSSVENMEYMFNNTRIVDVDALETKQHPGKDYVSWSVSKVTNMGCTFSFNPQLSDISALASWNTGSVTNMSRMFDSDTALSDVSALASWDISSVTNMSGMFSSAKSLTNISALASWDTSNVTDMSSMFSNTKIINVDALETKQHDGKDYVSWDTSKVTNMEYMFWGVTSLTDISALASWDTSSVTNMSRMFDSVPARPLPTWYHE